VQLQRSLDEAEQALARLQHPAPTAPSSQETPTP
jgi:electron transport complex protein RnfB